MERPYPPRREPVHLQFEVHPAARRRFARGRAGNLGVCEFHVSYPERHRVVGGRPPHRLPEKRLYRSDLAAERSFRRITAYRTRLAVRHPLLGPAFGGGSTYPFTCDIPASRAPPRQHHRSAATPQNLDDNTWIYNVSLSHKFFENFLAYVNVGSSWRPPAVSVGINNAANDPTLNTLLKLKSETSTDYEAGIKWTFLENRARLNLAYFHQTFKNFIYSGLPVTYLSDNGATTTPAQFSFNSNPDAVINGVNLDTGYLITRQWSADLNAHLYERPSHWQLDSVQSARRELSAHCAAPLYLPMSVERLDQCRSELQFRASVGVPHAHPGA